MADDKVEYKFNDPLTIIDDEWVTTGFLTGGAHFDDLTNQNRFVSAADFMFTDTALGGNIAINNLPQFCRYSDVRRHGRLTDREEVSAGKLNINIGMGRYRAEAFEQYSQKLYMEAGVPKFRSLFSFFSRAVDYETSITANYGRFPLAYSAGKVVGKLGVFVAFPLITVLVYAAKYLKSAIFGDTDMSYYSLDRKPHMFWGIANNICTMFASELGVVPQTIMDNDPDRMGTPVTVNQDQLNQMKELLPDFISDSNYIDVYAIVQKKQVEISEALSAERALFEADGVSKDDYYNFLKRKHSSATPQSFSSFLDEIRKNEGLYNKGDPSEYPEPSSSGDESLSATKSDEYLKKSDDGTFKTMPGEKNKKQDKTFLEYFGATFRDSTRYSVVHVEYTGASTVTFTNSTKEIPAKSKLNSLGGGARDIRFSLAGGNVFGSVVDTITTGLTDFAKGTLDGLTFGLSNVIAGLMDGGYVSFPKMYSGSSITLPTHSFKMVLPGLYGHPLYKLLHQYVPLSIILAHMLPLGTGQNSYTSPMLVSAFLRGICNITNGMITSCSIKTGTDNFGMTTAGRQLGIEVEFTITDLSDVMVAPVSAGLFGAFEMSTDDNALLSRYVATLCGRDLFTSRYTYGAAKLRMARTMLGWNKLQSPAFWASAANESLFFIPHLGLPGSTLSSLGGD